MRKSELVLTLALLGSTATAAWLWTELQAERARNADLSARTHSPAALVANPVTAATPEPTPAPSPAAAISANDSAPAQPSSVVHGRQEDDGAAYQRRMLQQPKYREAWRAQMRLNYALRRENVIRLLGFTPEQADAVVEIEIDRRLSWAERTPPNPITDDYRQQEQAWADQNEREEQEKLRALLGEEKLARFQEYIESRATRAQIDQFRPQFTGEDALRDDQVEPLIAALHVERASMQQELNEYRKTVNWEDAQSSQQAGERQLELLKAAYGRMHSSASPILSNSQLERLDALLKRDLERQEAEMRIRRMQMKAN